MMDLIKLRSKWGIKNYLKKIAKVDDLESPTYVLETGSPYWVGETSSKNKFINPSGGPMIIVGCELEEAKAVVKSIDFVKGYGWTITFE